MRNLLLISLVMLALAACAQKPTRDPQAPPQSDVCQVWFTSKNGTVFMHKGELNSTRYTRVAEVSLKYGDASNARVAWEMAEKYRELEANDNCVQRFYYGRRN